MSDNIKRAFPQYLSAPFQILWYESDELALFMFFLVLALMYGNVFWLLLISGPYIYSRIKRQNPRGFLCHLLYMAGLIRMKNYPAYFEKVFSE
ncbi:MAG: type IV conjugative transfer system protein TraL [Thermodesulfobacteriota bacterium]